MDNFFISALNIGFDFLFSIFLINNLVVLIWRIIWDTQDLYLVNNLYLNSLISLAVAICLTFIVKIIQTNEIKFKAEKAFLKTLQQDVESQEILKKKNEYEKTNNNGRTWKKFKLKSFIFMFSVANINNWRGIWNFTLIYTNYSMFGVLTIGFVSLLVLFAIRRVCALVSVPFFINKDCYQNAYQIQPTSVNHNYYLSLKDSLATKSNPNSWQVFLSFVLEYLADCFTIQAWRSLWFFLDLYLLPNDKLASSGISLIIGCAIYLIMLTLNKRINFHFSEFSEKQKGTKKHESKLYRNLSMRSSTDSDIVDIQANMNLMQSNLVKNKSNNPFEFCLEKIYLNLSFFILFIGTVNLWRGLWMLQTLYCYPKVVESNALNQNLLNSVYFLIALVVLWNLNLVSSLLARSSCEDTYFLGKKNYLMKQNHFRTYFGIKKDSAQIKTAKCKSVLINVLFCCDEQKEMNFNNPNYDSKTIFSIKSNQNESSQDSLPVLVNI